MLCLALYIYIYQWLDMYARARAVGIITLR